MAKQKYELRPGVTIFYDDESELKVVGRQQVELDEDHVTGKTARALMSGALVKVSATREDEKKAKR